MKGNPKRRRLLIGIDPGTLFTGFGVIEVKGTTLKMVDCGVVKASPKYYIAKRLDVIFTGLEEVTHRYELEAGAVEETFAGVNPKSAIAMGQGRGVALLALARAKLPILELSPTEVKKAVTGNGRASKEIVARMVCARLGLKEIPTSNDITDALAVAIALANRIPT